MAHLPVQNLGFMIPLKLPSLPGYMRLSLLLRQILAMATAPMLLTLITPSLWRRCLRPLSNGLARTVIGIATILSNTPHDSYVVGVHSPVTTFSIDENDAVTYPPVPDVEPADEEDEPWHPIDDADAIDELIAGVDILPLLRDVEPDRPDAAAGPDALALYVVVKGVYDVYQAEVALQAAYIAAVEAEMDADDDRLSDYFAVELDELVPDATGRDNMLHPYVVTIAPKYPAGKADIVLKIGAWEDTYVPANKYTPPDN